MLYAPKMHGAHMPADCCPTRRVASAIMVTFQCSLEDDVPKRVQGTIELLSGLLDPL